MRYFFPLFRVFSYILVVCFLLSGPVSGRMSLRAADNLQKSITCLHQKVLDLQQIQAQGGAIHAPFLQNLIQLRTNLIYLYHAAYAPADQLDVATIGVHLHNNLRQSAFTDSRGQFNVPVQGALPNTPPNNPGHPSEPFTVDSGKSAWFDIVNPQQQQAGVPIEVPLHNTVLVDSSSINQSLQKYRYNEWSQGNRAGIDIPENGVGPSQLQDFHQNFKDYIFPGHQYLLHFRQIQS